MFWSLLKMGENPMTLIDANVVELELARKLFWLMCHDFIFF